jgi:hypothetical protein
MRALLAAAATTLLFAGVALAAQSGPPQRPPLRASDADGAAIALPVPEEGEVAAEFLVDGTPVFVVSDARLDGPIFLEAISSHSHPGQPEPVVWCARAGMFEEPLHGARFDVAGDAVHGPAPHGLASYTTSRQPDGTLLVHGRIPGAPREHTAGPNRTLAPTGETCLDEPPPFSATRFHHQDRMADAASPRDVLDWPEDVSALVRGHVVTRGGRAWACAGFVPAGPDALDRTCPEEGGVPLDEEGQRAAAEHPQAFGGWQGLFVASHRDGALRIVELTGGYHSLGARLEEAP